MTKNRLRHPPSPVRRAAPLSAAALCVLVSAGCVGRETDPRGSQAVPTAPQVEAISFLGEELTPVALPAERRERLEAQLATARKRLESEPESADALIWVGRRTAYLGRYREAIDVFTEGVERFPGDPRFLRHRGHRFISVRQLERAVDDLGRAAEMVRGEADQIEPDGLPNDRDVPTSTLHANIWYHLGLAHYLGGYFQAALTAYRQCEQVAHSADMQVATAYWLYLTLRRLGRDEEAEDVLAAVTPDMDVIENHSYHRLLLYFGGHLEALDVSSADDSLDQATVGYGLAAWSLVEGDDSGARAELERVLEGEQWAAFGYLAAEAELARLRDRG